MISGRPLLIQKLEGIDGLKVMLKERELDNLFFTQNFYREYWWKLISKDKIIKPITGIFSNAPILGVGPYEREVQTKLRILSETD